MKRAIDLLTDVHFTRLDLAFDVFNNELGMKYRIYRPNVSQRIWRLYGTMDQSGGDDILRV